MYHSITFGDKNTWDDWHLIPLTRPVFPPPPVKTNYVEVPGINGRLELMSALVGGPTFGNRTGSFAFAVANDYWPWETAYSTILNYLHGRRMRAVLEDDPGYYHEGRFSISEWASNPNFSTITIDYNVSPFKMAVEGG